MVMPDRLTEDGVVTDGSSSPLIEGGGELGNNEESNAIYFPGISTQESDDQQNGNYGITCIEDKLEKNAMPLASMPSDKLLGRGSILVYGIGHMLNDLTSACWFTYLLLFLTQIGLTPRDAAIVMLSGQVGDAVATVFVGEFIDRFGYFKLWHAGGSVLVAISFSSVFGACLICAILGSHSLIARTIGYSIFAVIFNIGWAAAQVSHMALVNCITSNPTSRVALTSCRNAFTMVANLSLYGIAFAVFKLIPGRDSAGIEKQYRWIAFSAIFVGACFVSLFLFGVKEPRLQHHKKKRKHGKVSWIYWFKRALYYKVASVYTLARLITNVSQALLAFYVIDDLRMSESSKAEVPAIIYICSFTASIILQELHWTGRRLKIFFTLGAFLWMLSASLIYLFSSNMGNYIYLLSLVIGTANALVMVTAISMQSVLVGENLGGCAFVYGSLSFLEKLSCGIALYIIEDFHTSDNGCQIDDLGTCRSLTQMSLAFVPGGCALLGILITMSMDLDTPTHRHDELHDPLLV